MIGVIIGRLILFGLAGAALAALAITLYIYWPVIVAASLEQKARLRRLRRNRDLRDQ